MPMDPKIPDSAWLALDVGGANLKAAHSSGGTGSLPFEVWKHPEDLSDAIVRLTSAFPSTSRLALTMTAELCDCFPTRRVGVNAVLDSVVQALPHAETHVWCIDERFHPISDVREDPLLAAAANWLALAKVCAGMIPDRRGMLIDIGTTTTDLIPLDRGQPVPTGRSDTERLQSGELVYAGIRRTPLCSLATELEFRGRSTGLAAELFATTLDVYLTLGTIEPDPSELSTADGRPATPDASLGRLARMVGEDREGFSANDARDLASAADTVLLDRLIAAARKVSDSRLGGPPDSVILAGSGEFLARRLAERLLAPGGTIVSLEKTWGAVRSTAACAYSLVILASNGNPLQPIENLE
jgi:probable H4MPT-linked C1 transfer pathway protein